MHELGLTARIVTIAEEHAREAGAAAIRSVIVEIGALSGVVPEAVEFAFEACAAGTLAEGARLEIRRIPGRGRCLGCGLEQELGPDTFTCSACGALGLERLQGEEMRILELEVD